MDRIEFFFDPVCPWAWITSRWVGEARLRRDVAVDWRFISLKVVNDRLRETGAAPADQPPEYAHVHRAGARMLRVAAAVRSAHGNDAVGELYTGLGDQLHPGGASSRIWSGEDAVDELVGKALAAADLPAGLAGAVDDDGHDAVVRTESLEALARTGDDVGTPIITWDPRRPAETSLFGPVINRIPRGEEAADLWDAVLTVARTPGLAELKRSLRGGPTFD